jgi:aryl-alcohol dehydrogenase-like predicted oxidoreductase
MEQRVLGRTGVRLSLIGFGGIVVMNASEQEASERVREAIEHGINYFDVAPSYGDAEVRLGPALEPYRNEVFLACKTGKRDRHGAATELRQSLEHLRTDHVDLYQLHALTEMSELDEVFGADGALKTFLDAREQGLVRYLGFSAHSAEVALEAMRRFDFDSILFPFNFVTWHQAGFGPQVLEMAREKGMGRLCLKAMARMPWPEGQEEHQRHHAKCWYEPLTDPREIDLALRFALSLDVTAALPPGEADLLGLAVEVAERFTPLSDAEQEMVRQKAAHLAPLFRLSAA